jgi:N-sulfoglucosamine sulfohydrolase
MDFNLKSILVTAFLSGVALAATLRPSDAADKTNLVVFLSDDHTLTDSSLYGDGTVPTPNMDRIAEAGMTFHKAFVASPSCAPSRAALLTGLVPQRNGAEANHSRPHADIKKLPAYFQELGYEVVSFGKVGHYVQTPEYGFDLAKHFTYHEDVAVGEAIKWLKARESEKPLCLFIGTNWPHVPWPTDSSFRPEDVAVHPNYVDTPETRKSLAAYYEAIKIMDQELGIAYDAAYEKLGSNTMFLHTSDHGAQWPFGKWSLYESGIRTPLIATWPGKIEPNSMTDAMVSWIDILPTMIEAADGTAPPSIDGKSFLPVLLNQSKRHREIVFTTHSGDGNMNVFPIRAARDARWKYILNLHPDFEFRSHVTEKPGDTGYWPSWVEAAKTDPSAADKVRRYTQRPLEELYDLENDPHEQNNLASDPAHAETLARLSKELTGWMDKTGDKRQVFGMPKMLRREAIKPNIK